MKKFDIDKIINNISDKDVKKINLIYKNKSNKEDSFNKWFFDTFIFDKILFEGLFLSLIMMFLLIVTIPTKSQIFYAFLALVFIYFFLSFIITTYNCINNKISLILFFRIKRIAVTTYLMEK